MPIARLNRTVIRLSGENVTDWLDGLITNSLSEDISFAALLTPQGKIIADFFVIKDGENLLLDTADKYAAGLMKRLKMYKLRAKIDITETDLSVYALWDGTGEEGHIDPRNEKLGRRIIADYMDTEHDEADYDLHRLSLSIPNSAWDFDTSETFPANANMDRLNGVDFKKGCFVGQEVVSRMYRKTDVRKRMQSFRFEGGLEGTNIKAGDRTTGEVMHTRGNLGMAMIRLDRLPEDDTPLMVGETVIELIDHGNPQK